MPSRKFEFVAPVLQAWNGRLLELSYSDPGFYALAKGLLVYAVADSSSVSALLQGCPVLTWRLRNQLEIAWAIARLQRRWIAWLRIRK